MSSFSLSSPSIEITLNWLDFSVHYNTFTSLFKFCDTAQSLLFPTGVTKEQVALHTMWSNNCVMRSNSAKLFLPHQQYANWRNIRIFPRLKAVGNTSWTCAFRVVRSDASHDATLLAVVETTMVATNDTHTTSVPIEYRDTLIAMVQQTSQQPLCLNRTVFSKKREQYFSQTQRVRMTDCDSLNHINNAIYATLAEETRLHAAFQNKYDRCSSSQEQDHNQVGSQATECAISYIGQAHPFEEMEVITWSEHLSTGRGSGTTCGGSNQKSGNTSASTSSVDVAAIGIGSDQIEYRTDFYVNGNIVSQTSLKCAASKL